MTSQQALQPFFFFFAQLLARVAVGCFAQWVSTQWPFLYRVGMCAKTKNMGSNTSPPSEAGAHAVKEVN